MFRNFLNGLKDRLIKSSAEKRLIEDFSTARQLITKFGGSDVVCSSYLETVRSDPKTMMLLEHVGVDDAKMPFNQVTIALASMNSIVKARRDIDKQPENEGALNRLEVASQTLAYSFLHFNAAHFERELEYSAKKIGSMIIGKSLEPKLDLFAERKVQSDNALKNWLTGDVSEWEVF